MTGKRENYINIGRFGFDHVGILLWQPINLNNTNREELLKLYVLTQFHRINLLNHIKDLEFKYPFTNCNP